MHMPTTVHVVQVCPSQASDLHVQSGTPEAAIALAHAKLLTGQLAGAACELQRGVEGTAAQEAVSDWVQAAKSRAVAEQAVKLLQAHASAQAAGLS